MSQPPPVPDQVVAAFSSSTHEPKMAVCAGRFGWRCGPIFLSQVPDIGAAVWSSSLREKLDVPHLEFSLPKRGTHGRFIVGNWKADHIVMRPHQPRPDESVLASRRLSRALVEKPKPNFLVPSQHMNQPISALFAHAGELAGQPGIKELPAPSGILSASKDKALQLYTLLSPLRTETSQPAQLIHSDLYADIRFTLADTPVIHDLPLLWAPAAFGDALVVVDALIAGHARADLCDRWAQPQNWNTYLVQAMMYRLAVHIMHHRSVSSHINALAAAAHTIYTYVGGAQGAWPAHIYSNPAI